MGELELKKLRDQCSLLLKQKKGYERQLAVYTTILEAASFLFTVLLAFMFVGIVLQVIWLAYLSIGFTILVSSIFYISLRKYLKIEKEILRLSEEINKLEKQITFRIKVYKIRQLNERDKS